MTPIRSLRLYQGQGMKLAERGLELPLFKVNEDLSASRHYTPDENLLDAVNVALTLGMPLLVTGEPGTGKTQLAASVAWELGLELFTFSTKSTSTYTDLFYQYDALRHFRDVQIEAAARSDSGLKTPRDTSIENYISFGPLGRAILLAMDRNDPNCPPDLRNQPKRRSVVLIDELDKAPRDLPNDILTEVEHLQFQIKELPPERNTFKAAREYAPILILTSNLEKDLPEAFRRRCVFYHIEFDNLDLRAIVEKRLPRAAGFSDEMLEHALAHFRSLRERHNLDKNPATAELLAWVDLLQRLNLDVQAVKDLNEEERVALASSYAILAKSDDDLKKLRGAVLDKTQTAAG
jgi:MoxR-like ATPase